ncbi:unnamed protein product, partial [marine sediment metagenome]
GDYVDRGPDSAGNLESILQTKLAHPEAVFLLMGNHEGWFSTVKRNSFIVGTSFCFIIAFSYPLEQAMPSRLVRDHPLNGRKA